VAHHAARLWHNADVQPLLTSFDVAALEGARHTQVHLPRGLLLDRLWPGWLDTALRLNCVAIVCHHRLWDSANMAQAKNAGFKTLSYTVNDEAIAQRLLNLGIDSLITDRVDRFNPASHAASATGLWRTAAAAANT
jgi:glycerophosphoryl diester phosphodiesterase